MWNIYKENDQIKFTKKEVENVLFTVETIPPRVEKIGFNTVLKADEEGQYIYWDFEPDPNYNPPAPEPSMSEIRRGLSEIKEMITNNVQYEDGYQAALILLGGEE